MTGLFKKILGLGPVSAVVCAALVMSCGAPTGDPVGSPGPDRPLTKVTLYPPDVDWRDTYYDVFVPTGRHYRLAVGSYGASGERFRSRMLLRFELGDVPKRVPVSKIEAVLLKLPYLRVSGTLNDDIYADPNVTLEARPLHRDFDEDRATWWRATRKENWTVEGGDFGPTVATAVVGKPSYQREFVTLDITQLGMEWFSNPFRNYGVMLKGRDEELGPGIKEFYSTNTYSKVDPPRLEITYLNDDDEKTYEVILPEKDCFITDYEGEFGGEEVHGYDEYLDFGSFNGYGRRVLIYFDLTPAISTIPADASIARAKLRLYYVPASRDERVYVALYRLTEAFREGAKQDELEFQKYHNNVAYIDREFKIGAPGYVDLYINPMVQEWVSGSHLNFGLMVKAPDEGKAQAFPRFGSRDNGQTDRRPYLEIEYTVPADPWYTSPGE